MNFELGKWSDVCALTQGFYQVQNKTYYLQWYEWKFVFLVWKRVAPIIILFVISLTHNFFSLKQTQVDSGKVFFTLNEHS